MILIFTALPSFANPPLARYAYSGEKFSPLAATKNEGVVPGLRLNIDLMVKELKLTYHQALEVQALLSAFHLHDASNEIFVETIQKVKAGHYLSHSKIEKIKASAFIVALDADLTIWDAESGLVVAPGYEILVERIRALGGSIVIYSRNWRARIEDNANKIKIGNHTLAEEVDGIFTNGHMTKVDDPLSAELDTDGDQTVRKDLRIFGLDKTVIVDDNVSYVLQKMNTRKVEPFHAGQLVSEGYRDRFIRQFMMIAHEIEESLNAMKRHKISFAEAYFPYTIEGNNTSESAENVRRKFRSANICKGLFQKSYTAL